MKYFDIMHQQCGYGSYRRGFKMKMKWGYLLAIASMFSLTLPFAVQASPITLPPTYNNSYYIYAYGDGFSSSQSGPISISKTANSVKPADHPASATGILDVKVSPFPSITASSSATGIGTAAVGGSLSYQFRIDDLSGVYDPSNQIIVPTIVTYKGSVSANSSNPLNSGASSYFNIAGTNFAESYKVVTGAAPSATHILATCCGAITDPTFSGTSFNEKKTYSVIANTFYRIDISATASDTFDGFATAYIDPYIQIDPNFADKGKYHIVLSPGIDNLVSAATVPLPAASWLLGSGLLGLVGVARRKYATRQ